MRPVASISEGDHRLNLELRLGFRIAQRAFHEMAEHDTETDTGTGEGQRGETGANQFAACGSMTLSPFLREFEDVYPPSFSNPQCAIWMASFR